MIVLLYGLVHVEANQRFHFLLNTSTSYVLFYCLFAYFPTNILRYDIDSISGILQFVAQFKLWILQWCAEDEVIHFGAVVYGSSNAVFDGD